MNPIISPGDKVSVENSVKGFFRSRCEATVLKWTTHGRLTVKLDGSGVVKNVLLGRVRKIADGPAISSL
ncbi:hypothetical protein [Spirosoma migulaei]